MQLLGMKIVVLVIANEFVQKKRSFAALLA
jgi:hypothetical protein